jgi:heme-degrading monooxygenase HmoA
MNQQLNGQTDQAAITAEDRTAPAGRQEATGSVTLINSFQVAPERDEAFRALWGETSRYFIARPGFVSLRLHRAVAEDAPYRWVNVAVWESEAAFRAAHGTEEFRRLVTVPGWAEFPSVPTLFEVDTEIG